MKRTICSRKRDFSQWYQDVIHSSELAEHAPVRGCMIIKPYGYAIWENVRSILDRRFKDVGVQNMYFPLLIPLNFLEKEASHVAGFATESVIVTHTRLEKRSDGTMGKASPLEEPFVIRSTSEPLVGDYFSKHITSVSDLPMKVNQWCNVMRWEKRPRLFLRTSEFLWQEGHTAHASSEEAEEFAQHVLRLYVEVMEHDMAIAVLRGQKTEGEKFPGAVNTYTLEGMMQDGKSLQLGTSHFMGQNFSRAFHIQFLSKDHVRDFVYTTSWGVTTRIIGSMVMSHGDDEGLCVPPRIAPYHVVVIPFIMGGEREKEIWDLCRSVKKELETMCYHGRTISVLLDDRNCRPIDKSWDGIKKGIPIRIEIGLREVEEGKVSVFLRIKGKKEACHVTREQLKYHIETFLEEIHNFLYEQSRFLLQENTLFLSSKEEFEETLQEDFVPGKFFVIPFKGNRCVEEEIQKKFGVTPRCILRKKIDKCCLFTGSINANEVVFAKSY